MRRLIERSNRTRVATALLIASAASAAWMGWFGSSPHLGLADLDTGRMLSTVLRLPAFRLGSILLALILVGLSLTYIAIVRATTVRGGVPTGLVFGVAMWLLVGCLVIPGFGLVWPSQGAAMQGGSQMMRPSVLMLHLGWRGPITALFGWALFGLVLGVLSPLSEAAGIPHLKAMTIPRRLPAFALVLTLLVAALVPSTRDVRVEASGSMRGVNADAMNVDTMTGRRNAMAAPDSMRPRMRGSEMPTVSHGSTLSMGSMGTMQPGTAGHVANRSTWVGVTRDEIKIAFAIDETGCGVDPLETLRRAAGPMPTQDRFFRNYPTTQQGVVDDHRESIEVLTRYWNERGSKAPPAAGMGMSDSTARPFHGRRLSSVLVDGGSAQCPDRTRSAAEEIAMTVKPFAVLNQDLDMPAAYNMAAALARADPERRPMHFGSAWIPERNYKTWAPYAWTFWPSGTTNVKQFASYVCARLAGKKALGSRDPQLKNSPRRFGLIHPDWQQSRILAAEFKTALVRSCGSNPVVAEQEYTLDIAQSARDADRVIRAMKSKGVTSLLMLTDLLYPLFQLHAAAREEYYPEWVWAGHNYTDTKIVQRLYTNFYADEVDRASFGITNMGVFGGFTMDPGPPFRLYHAYHPMSDDGRPCDPSSMEGMDRPGCKAPASIVLWYTTLMPLIAGLMRAGPELTPETLSRGLQASPSVRPAMGMTGWVDAQGGAGAGKSEFLVDAVEFRWRVKYKAPSPDDGAGWAEYPDCQRHYYAWPNRMAMGWEKNGALYANRCGSAKYAPADSPEKDGYPHWR